MTKCVTSINALTKTSFIDIMLKIDRVTRFRVRSFSPKRRRKNPSWFFQNPSTYLDFRDFHLLKCVSKTKKWVLETHLCVSKTKKWILETHLCVSKTKNGFWKRIYAFPKQRMDFGNAFMRFQNEEWILETHEWKMDFGFWKHINGKWILETH